MAKPPRSTRGRIKPDRDRKPPRRDKSGFKSRELPPVGVAEVAGQDADGELYVRLAKAGADAPLIRLAPERGRAGPAPGLGDRLLVKFETEEDGERIARIVKALGPAVERVMGVIRKSKREVRLEPVDRRSKDTYLLLDAPEDLRDGDLVTANPAGQGKRYGPRLARLAERLGREEEPRAFSMLAIVAHDLPMGFPEAAETEAKAAKPPTLEGREDLRAIPLLTIDPMDARDHDDAVFAEPDADPKNPGGWIVWVAIADVAAYVRTGSALDRTAWEKGNSAYFPDRVEPMLPEALSAGLCSLREGENRATMAVRMVFDSQGRKKSHRFVRGLMRSAAKLSYEQAQAAIDGRPDDKTGPLLETVLKPLWAAYRTMTIGREARAPIEIDSPERKIELSKEGEVLSIRPRERLDAHKLIEEMMIQANVCAAETLEQKRSPLVYRVHDTPSQEKIFNLADFLQTLNIAWSKGEAPRTERFNRLLDETRGGPHAEIVNEVVLRTQMQAHYSPDNIGHFGLNLQRYAHFTSPIRRYADLVVHRALIRALGLGDDGLKEEEIVRLQATAEHITATERRAMAAEREATDRYIAAFLADRVGADFTGRITGVTRFGLFVRLSETGADGLVPASTLGGEFWFHDEVSHALIGERTGLRWPLGKTVEVRLTEAAPLTGGLLFEMLSEPEPRDPNARLGRPAFRPKAGFGPKRGKNRPGGPKPPKSGKGPRPPRR
jgi:ribonuclease R